ncbi:ATP-dependent Clp protease ATP-binding subunit [Candidatus Uhrbacteria bacterium]|nr:ATP-dependent Clp protease ATP-binding subunit [Candidatus Uhrbacteria bacterium]
MDTNILDKFTTHLKNVLTRALCAVLNAPEPVIEPLQLLWALTHEKGSIGSEILSKVKITPETVALLAADEKKSTDKKNQPSPSDITPKLSAAAKRVIEKAVLSANLYEHKYVGTEHLLSGLMQAEDATVKKFLEEQGVELKTLRQQITLVLKSASQFPDLAASIGMPMDSDLPGMSLEPFREKRRSKKNASKTPALDFFSVDLTSPDIQADIDPVIGREAEIERVMQILCRRTKNNPILLGEPGVGKTAIVEGLAKKISQNEVPDILQGKRVLSLDLSLIIAGTMYRGEFEGRLKQIIDEVKSHPEIILFIDEVHTIIGAGSASGSLDAANILKPALARGDIRCLGATTLSEYKKHIESDPALERRFQSVIVQEPSVEKTLSILEGIKSNYETYHGVTITAEALTAAVELSERYLQEKFFPDKAIDLIDEAASAVRVRQKTSEEQQKIRGLEQSLNDLRETKRQAIIEERFMEAIAIKEQERAAEEEIKALQRKTGKQKARAVRLVSSHIADIVARMTGIPVRELMDTEKLRLQNMETTLGQRVLGQEAAIHAVAECVRRAKTGISHPRRPLASFLFVGPSGVGKTELAKIIAEEIFQDPDALIRLDMSEFAEGFTVTKLIGAPAGYVGYRDSAKLTDAVKRKPHAVVLFDELEKGHADVLNLLLQILEDGHVTDATGRKINFKNTIIIMTSNVGSELVRLPEVGFGNHQMSMANLEINIRKALAERFRPEFLNRIDRVCVFQSLGEAALGQIVDLQLEELNRRLKARHLAAHCSDQARNWIVKEAAKTEQGARAIRSLIQEMIENLVASFLLQETPTELQVLEFVMENGTIRIKNPVINSKQV